MICEIPIPLKTGGIALPFPSPKLVVGFAMLFAMLLLLLLLIRKLILLGKGV